MKILWPSTLPLLTVLTTCWLLTFLNPIEASPASPATLAPSGGEPMRWPLFPQISPNGDQVAFLWEGDLWLAPTNGGQAKRLTDHPAMDSGVRWNRSGTQLLFSSRREGSDDVWKISVDGGQPQRLTWWSGTDRACDWYPDEKSILISSDRVDTWKRGGTRLYSLTLPGDDSIIHEPQRITLAAAANARLSPSGKKILATRWGTGITRQGYEGSMASQIWLYDLTSQEWTQLTPTYKDHRSPVWIDDDHFLMVKTIDGRGQLVERNLSGNFEKVWTNIESDSVRSPSISRDGQHIFFESEMNAWHLHRKTGEMKKVSWYALEDLAVLGLQDLSYNRATSASVSADGKMLAVGSEGDILVRRVKNGLSVNRVTHHPAKDTNPVWLPLEEGQSVQNLLFVSRRGGTENLYTLKSTEEGEPRLDRCRSTEVTPFPGSGDRRRYPQISPDGKLLAFVLGDGDLAIQNLDGSDSRVLHTGWSPPSFEWSPDSRWIAFSTQDNNFNRDIWLVPVDGTRAPFNLTANPRPDRSPRWSPDGKKLAFISQRDESGGDLWWLWLTEADDQPGAEDRELASDPLPSQEKSDDGKKEKNGSKNEKEDSAKKAPEVKIDLKGIRDRFTRAFSSDSGVRGPAWGSKSKKIFFVSSHESSSAVYSVDTTARSSAKKVTSGRDPFGPWIAKSKKYLRLASGVPQLISESGSSTSLPISSKFTVDQQERQGAVFDEAWATMRDRFYDIDLKGLDWDAIGELYRPYAVQRRHRSEFEWIINRMIGELNSSHQRFSAAGKWSRSIRATGVPGWRWGRDSDSGRYQVGQIVPGTPAADEAVDVQPGDLILAIDGSPLTPGSNTSIPLNGKVGKRVAFELERDGEAFEVILRPISNNVLRSRLYDHWLEECRQQVHRESAGRLGYLHIRSMDQTSLDRFAVQLYEAGHDREGLVIDVRENGGGWTTDRLLVSLTRQPHALTQPRAGGLGYPNDRLAAPSWTKPIAVLCNENSYSNAEIFSHAIKNLKRGPLIGMPTSGSVISTGSSTLIDGSSIRVPFRGWYTIPGGLDMDLNGAIPDLLVPSTPEAEENHWDFQLDMAIERLLEDLPPAPRATF